MMFRGATRWAGLVFTTLIAATAAADPPIAAPIAPIAPIAPTASPIAPAPADPPPVAPAAPARKAAARAPEPELPDPEVRLSVVAPSAQAPWTLRIENEGAHPVRVPADVRLLRFALESSDTMAKRPAKPVTCAAPAGLRPDGFPERNALLLGPGDAYVETFDPRLFCFGKDAKLLAGGALVRAHYGWDAPRGAKKVGPPYAVEGTEFPAEVASHKQLTAPPLVLSYMPPEHDEAASPPTPAPTPEPKAGGNVPPAAGPPHAGDEKPAGDEHPVDENAPRLELSASPWADAAMGYKVAITVTVTNVGHRAALAAIRTRAVGFRVQGPGGVVFRCGTSAAAHAIAREGFQTLRPGGAVSLTVLVEEACGRELFRRPGLYRVTPSLHLHESGAELGLSALTGLVHAREPTLVRVATGPEPFYQSPPRALHTPKVDEVAGP